MIQNKKHYKNLDFILTQIEIAIKRQDKLSVQILITRLNNLGLTLEVVK